MRKCRGEILRLFHLEVEDTFSPSRCLLWLCYSKRSRERERERECESCVCGCRTVCLGVAGHPLTPGARSDRLGLSLWMNRERRERASLQDNSQYTSERYIMVYICWQMNWFWSILKNIHATFGRAPLSLERTDPAPFWCADCLSPGWFWLPLYSPPM